MKCRRTPIGILKGALKHCDEAFQGFLQSRDISFVRPCFLSHAGMMKEGKILRYQRGISRTSKTWTTLRRPPAADCSGVKAVDASTKTFKIGMRTDGRESSAFVSASLRTTSGVTSASASVTVSTT